MGVTIRTVNQGKHQYEEIEIDTAGLGGMDKARFVVEPCRCGEITDGISIDLSFFSEFERRSGFVVSYEDFMAVAEAARRVRE